MDERLAVGTTQQEVGRQAASSGINKRKCTHSLTQSSEDEEREEEKDDDFRA